MTKFNNIGDMVQPIYRLRDEADPLIGEITDIKTSSTTGASTYRLGGFYWLPEDLERYSAPGSVRKFSVGDKVTLAPEAKARFEAQDSYTIMSCEYVPGECWIYEINGYDYIWLNEDQLMKV